MKAFREYWLVIAYFLALMCIGLNGHSWLACTDYVEKNAGRWTPSKCRGFPRYAHVKVRKDGIFGIDNGYDHRPSEGNVCNFPYDSSSYTPDHPMAVYYPGQQVVLVHPMKNHGADGQCGSIWIPDTGSWLFAVRTNGENNDPNLATFRSNQIFDLGRSPSGHDFGSDHQLASVYPKPGYGNAPRFCENTDKALATYSFNVPRNLRPGLYSFVWLWSFNAENDRYSTCFEVEIVANKRARDSRLGDAGFTDLTEPCGGLTSNPEVVGNSNPGCTRPRVNVNSYAVVAASASTSPPQSTESTSSTTATTTTTAPPTSSSTYSAPPTSFTNPPAPAPTNNGFQTYPWSVPRAPSLSSVYWKARSTPDFERVHLSVDLHMRSTQFSGELWLPVARQHTMRRHISVDFTCQIDIASFWNCRTLTNLADAQRTNHYDLMQRGNEELETNVIFYHVSFTEGCDLSRHPPIARLVQEDFQ